MHTHAPTHPGRESHLRVSFIGADTLLCSAEWNLMSEAQDCESPTGQRLARAENGGGNNEERREEGRVQNRKDPEKMRGGG